ncbi:hypothetical protein QRD89_02275 [Halobacillus sp. ACCC02827]|uniref:hypothetical protein n=1 Tax=Halobacillus sp. ACCC02827 TaxID=3052090 RepID=UPI0025700CF3|nr:hypothetical protein [Halobacillus sp. ACCC02827]WJE16197.1 hypothetical protein QRD89_02275 [Halobacillus sp. ACCC02827]
MYFLECVNKNTLLTPSHKKTKKRRLNTESNYDEEEMEELMNISEGAGDHGED